MGSRKRARWPWVVASVLLVLAVPVLLHLSLRASHAAGYHGVCGPHATDIPAHPCTQEEYLQEFGAGFEGLGLLLVEGFATVCVAGLVGLVWLIALVGFRRRPAAASGRQQSP